MDPVVTLAELLSALACRDRETAIEAARDLADWLDRGGFVPDLDQLPTAVINNVLKRGIMNWITEA